jgi:hypothetical protein
MSPAGARRRISLASVFFVLVAALATTSARGQSRFDPALHFRTITTEHFVLYFHQGEERNAARLAAVAEDTWHRLSGPFRVTPPARTHVVLVDQTELANGSATPLPYDTIVVTATWPAGSEFLGRTDDWLRLVFTHEFTHIVHLDRSEGWARALRGVFGRVPLAFPNIFLPTWQIEGLAVYEESAITSEGRLHAGDFLAIEQEARRAHAVEPLDRANGGLTDWPDGFAQYAFGAGFHEYLVDRYGADTLAALADATAGRVPYTSSRAFAHVYGKSLGDLWRDYQSQPASETPPPIDDHAVRITHHGFTVSGPRFAPPACPTCSGEIVYSAETPEGFPSLNAISADGSRDHQLTTRYLGSTAGVGERVVVFDQHELRRSVGLYGDLFALDRASGRVRALTSEARFLDPDLSPDGTTIVCVHDHDGQRDLVLVRFDAASGRAGDVTTLAADADTEFEAPRWSPDGTSIAVARHGLGSQSEIVVVDPGTGAVRVVASDPAARIVTPAWRPDGQAILAAADFGDVFNLYEFDIHASREPAQITHTTGGATWPDVSRDGQTIVFVGYTVAGFDLFTMPYPAGREPFYVLSKAAPDPQLNVTPVVEPSAAYSPWPTLKPTSWMPFFDNTTDQLRLGVAVAGYDVLGYHGYALAGTWLVSAPKNADTPSAASPDWQASYVYARWRPAFFVTASRSTSFFAGPPTDAGLPTNSTLRQYQLEAGVQVPFRHVRIAHRAFASILRSSDDYALADGTLLVRRTALRTGWATTTAHIYGYSISPEGGVAIGATAEAVRQALGSTADATTFTADARVYLPGLGAHHVVALRAAGGQSTGSEIAERTFLLGGAAAAPDVLNFDSRAASLLRGFPPDTFAGTHVAVINADYRFPLAHPERGHGTLPIFLSAVYGTAFADAGNAWTTSRTFRAGDVKTSAGLELSADLVAGYSFPFAASLGIGWGHDGAGLAANGRTVYLRIGRAF